ncbi:hypothetical protein Franean1_0029 [Parafrankia sp. EAN1pec]|nr:hypothetical protein Franean1_0029 [Frankia sp. EAN1pec]
MNQTQRPHVNRRMVRAFLHTASICGRLGRRERPEVIVVATPPAGPHPVPPSVPPLSPEPAEWLTSPWSRIVSGLRPWSRSRRVARDPADVVLASTRGTIAFGSRPQDAGDLAGPGNLVPAECDLSRLPVCTATVRVPDAEAGAAAHTARIRSLPPAVNGRTSKPGIPAWRHVACHGVGARRGICRGTGTGL